MDTEANAIIGQGIVVRGEVSGDSPLTIAGTLEGELRLDAEATVAPEGLVKGTVEAPAVQVAGQIEGDVRASEWIRLDPGCRVQGTLAAPRVIIEEGAVLNATLEMDVGPSEAGGGHE